MPAFRTPDGRWRYRIKIALSNGKKTRIGGCSPRWNNTERAALQAEREHIARVQREAAEGPKPVPAPAKEVPTVSSFLTTYLDVSRVKNKPSSVDAKETILRMHILPHLGHLRLDQVTYGVIEDLKVTLAATPIANRDRRERETSDIERKRTPKERTLSSKTINNCLTVLRRMLSIACKRGLIEAVPEIEWLRPPKPDFDFLTYEEAERLIDAADGEWRTMIVVALRTGLRFGELRGLRWQDVDLVAGRLMVRQSIVKDRVGSPKSGKPREVPLGDEVRAALKAHRHLRGPLVFCNLDGGVLTVGEPRWALERACKRAGLRLIGWHVLRHTFASHLAMRGAPLKAVQELLGHATIQMTMRYAHLAPEVAREAVRLLDVPGRAQTVPKPGTVAAN